MSVSNPKKLYHFLNELDYGFEPKSNLFVVTFYSKVACLHQVLVLIG